MSKIKNGGLDQYGAEAFEQQQFGAAGVEGVNAVWRAACIVPTESIARRKLSENWPAAQNQGIFVSMMNSFREWRDNNIEAKRESLIDILLFTAKLAV